MNSLRQSVWKKRHRITTRKRSASWMTHRTGTESCGRVSFPRQHRADMKKNYFASVRDFETALGMDSSYSKTCCFPIPSLAGTGKVSTGIKRSERFLASPKLNIQSVNAGNTADPPTSLRLRLRKNIPPPIIFFRRGTPVTHQHHSARIFPSLDRRTKMIFNRRATTKIFCSNRVKWCVWAKRPARRKE